MVDDDLWALAEGKEVGHFLGCDVSGCFGCDGQSYSCGSTFKSGSYHVLPESRAAFTQIFTSALASKSPTCGCMEGELSHMRNRHALTSWGKVSM